MNRDVPRVEAAPRHHVLLVLFAAVAASKGEIKLMRNTYILYRLLLFECVSQNVPTLSRRITLLFVPWPPCCSSLCRHSIQWTMGSWRGTDAVPRTISSDFENTPAYCHIVKAGLHRSIPRRVATPATNGPTVQLSWALPYSRRLFAIYYYN